SPIRNCAEAARGSVGNFWMSSSKSSTACPCSPLFQLSMPRSNKARAPSDPAGAGPAEVLLLLDGGDAAAFGSTLGGVVFATRGGSVGVAVADPSSGAVPVGGTAFASCAGPVVFATRGGSVRLAVPDASSGAVPVGGTAFASCAGPVVFATRGGSVR